MGTGERENPKLEDGRPVEERDGRTPQPKEEKEKDMPDASTVKSIGY